MDISQAHDSFFRFVVSKTERAAGLIKMLLPPSITQYLQFDTLASERDTFVEPHLKNRFSDALFSAHMTDGEPAFLYFLIDHKSSPDPGVTLQLLRYYNQIWEDYQNNHPGSHLPPIIGMVIYHGSRPWNIGGEFKERFKCPEEVQPFLPLFRYVLLDLSAVHDEQMQGSADLKAALMLMKYIFHPKLNQYLPEIIKILKHARHQPDFLFFFEAFMLYLMKYLNHEHYPELECLVQSELVEEGEKMMPSIADMLHEKGREEGREEGRQQLIRGILKLLQVKFQQLPETLRDKIIEIRDQTVLDAVMDHAVTAESLQQFVNGVTPILPEK